VAAAVMTTVCTTVRRGADEDWRAGRWAEAAAAYEAALDGWGLMQDRDRVLYRLGLAYAAPSSPVCDTAKARSRLGELVTRHPHSEFREPAEVVLQLLDALDVAESVRATLRRDSDTLKLQATTALADAKVKEAAVARLRVALAETQAELAKVREALEQLKRIDLQRRP
jgi:hypothetical protein